MTERFRDDERPLNNAEQGAWDGLAGLLAEDTELGATYVEFNTAAKEMLPTTDSNLSPADTAMYLPDDTSAGSLLERDPWSANNEGWKPSGMPLSVSEARQEFIAQRRAEASLPWYRRKIGRIVGSVSCFGAAAAAIVAAGTGFMPASPQIPDTLVLRDKIARNPDLLKGLGICASELHAQGELDKKVITRPSGRQLRNIEITQEAVKTAEKSALPCVSSSGQEAVTVDGVQMTRPELTIYKDTNWCDQRKEIRNEAPLNTEYSRGDVLAVGNRYFGFRCQ